MPYNYNNYPGIFVPPATGMEIVKNRKIDVF